MVDINQSDIAEVKDQLSLDFADGSKLNTVGSNLGLNRPIFGFDDDTWRAIVKVLALSYKQIANKFRDVLAIMFGPRVTVAGSLSTNSLAGDSVIFLNNTDDFPQVGTVVIDELTSVAETVDYYYIDRVTGAMFLAEPLIAAHNARDDDTESIIISYSVPENVLIVTNTAQFPTTDYPYPVVIGRGTASEEVVLVTDNDQTNNRLTLFVPPLTTRLGLRSTPISTSLAQDYFTTSYFLVGLDLTQFPSTGLVKLGPSSSVFTVVSGAVDSVTVAASTFTTDSLAGYVVRFDGNIDVTLAGKEVTVSINTDSSIQFTSSLPVVPGAGETFTIRPILEYTSINRDDNALTIRRAITSELSFDAGTDLELIEGRETVALSTVKSAGVDWDVIQTQPRIIELLIPDAVQDTTELRSAVYMHTTQSAGTSTTVSTTTAVGDTEITVADTSSFPKAGVAYFSYGTAYSSERLGFYVTDATTLTLAASSFLNVHTSGDTVLLYEPAYAGTSLLIGDYNTEADTFPGPYIYNLGEDAPTGEAGLTTLDQMLPGPTTLLMSQEVNRTALEVLDGTSWDRVNFPYTAIVGEGTTARELVTINDLNFRSRAVTTVATLASVGSTVIEVAALSLGGAGDAADFPNSYGYRVLLDKGTATEEVVYVIATATGPNRLLLESATTYAHAVSATVELMADVLSVNTLTIDHTGIVPYSQRSTTLDSLAAHPNLGKEAFSTAESAYSYIDSFDVVSAAAFDSTGGHIILNFGNNTIPYKTTTTLTETPGSTLINVTDGSGFPVWGEYVIVIAPNSVNEERAIVTVRSGNILTVDFGIRNTHAAGTPVIWEPGEPESINYSSIIGNTLSFTSPLVLQSIHSTTELVIDSSTTSDPSTYGFDFPFRMPPDSAVRLQYLLDIIRAAGIQVEIISQR